jgi:hypothetical protein
MLKEPVRVYALAISLAQAIIGVLLAFWADSELLAALGVLMGVLTQALAEVPRAKVTPMAKLREVDPAAALKVEEVK